MTALCPGGGASVPRFGTPLFLSATVGAFSLLLSKYGATKLQFLIPLLGFVPFDMATFCSVDPPAMPSFTDAEIYALIFHTGDANFLSGLEKARDMVKRMLWYDFCECSSGTATPIVNPVMPTTTPTLVVPTASLVTPCQSFTHTGVTGYCSGSFSYWLGASPVDRSATKWRITSTGAIQSSGGVSYRYQMQENGTGVFANTVLTDTFPPEVAHTFSGVIANPNTTYLAGHIQYVSGGGCSMAQDTLELYCGGTPGAVQAPCCPPDPATQAYLDLILSTVTLIQRQAAPFGYVYGTNHAALSGNGSFGVSDLLGVSVDVTTLPASYGRATGTPEKLFDLGYVTLGTADGYSQSRRIDADGSLVLPPSGGIYTLVGYTLSPGVVVSIRELVREP